VPEGDTIFRAARTLNRALAGHQVTRFETALPQLSRIDEDAPIAGRTVTSVTSQGKWMLMNFSGDLILLTHMLMSGSWHIYRPGETWQRPRADMRIVIVTDEILAVAFRVPIAEFHSAASLARRRGFNKLGQDVLTDDFNEEEAQRSIRSRPELEVGVALLTQSVLAGLGNVFKSEVCFASGINPFTRVSSLTDAELQTLIANSRRFMLANVTDLSGDQIVTYTGFRRTTRRADPSQRLWVYKRAGQPCRRCGTPIELRKQGVDARVTFWCPRCQPAA
jgi:endonuclease-8